MVGRDDLNNVMFRL